MAETTSFSVDNFLTVLQSVFETGSSPHSPSTFGYCPVLATVLVSRYQQQIFLSLNAYEKDWSLSYEAIPSYGDLLVIEIPKLIERMYRILVEDQTPANAVVDIDALRTQMEIFAREAYQRTYRSM